MPISYDDKSILEVFQDLQAEKLVLPNFQRSFVWDVNKQKSLLASLLVGLPIGSLLTLEGAANSFQKRKICLQDSLVSERAEHNFLLDGQQRLSTLRAALHDIFGGDDWAEILEGSFGKIRNRWFINLKGDDEDHFKLSSLNYSGLDKLIDLDVLDYLVPQKIYKTKQTEVHHPGFLANCGSAEERNERIQTVIESYAANFLVPLYELDLKKLGIHRKVLERIARRRSEVIRSEIEISGFAEHTLQKFLPNDNKGLISLYERFRSGPSNEKVVQQINYEWMSIEQDWSRDIAEYLESLLDSKIPFIELDSNETSRAVAIFEAVNKGGVPLSVYDLIVAKSAQSDDFKNLSSQILDELDQPIEINSELSLNYVKYCEVLSEPNIWTAKHMDVNDDNSPSRDIKDWFVNLLSLLVHKYRHNDEPKLEQIKRDKILALTTDDISSYWMHSIRGIIRALAFLQMRCGIVKAKNVAYKHMVLVLGFILEDDSNWQSRRVLDILEYWYWGSLFSGKYIARQNERCEKDLRLLKQAVQSQKVEVVSKQIDEEDLLNVKGYATKELILREVSENDDFEVSAARNGILQFILAKHPLDYLKINNDMVENHVRLISAWRIARGEIVAEIHHIIPLASQKAIDSSTKELRQERSHYLNSVTNFTYTTKASNNWIGTKSPREYFKHIDSGTLDAHCIPEISGKEYTTELEQKKFMEHRFNKILRGIKARLLECR